MPRSAGILMPITSLPSPYGIGTMGKAAYEFVDFLKASGQQYWQLLPVGPTSYGDSPYQSCSAFAGNPYLIDFDLLAKKGWLCAADYEGLTWDSDPDTIDYALLYQQVMDYTKDLADDCQIPQGFIDFILRWNAFKAAVETEHYIPAIKFWKMLFENQGGKTLAHSTKPCGCHG